MSDKLDKLNSNFVLFSKYMLRNTVLSKKQTISPAKNISKFKGIGKKLYSSYGDGKKYLEKERKSWEKT